jgi:hypothetical protein
LKFVDPRHCPLSIEIRSPVGAVVGQPALIAYELFLVGGAPTAPAGFPDVHLAAQSAIVADVLVALPAGGFAVGYTVPPGLMGLVARIQAFAFSPTAANGIFVASDAHDIVF